MRLFDYLFVVLHYPCWCFKPLSVIFWCLSECATFQPGECTGSQAPVSGLGQSIGEAGVGEYCLRVNIFFGKQRDAKGEKNRSYSQEARSLWISLVFCFHFLHVLRASYLVEHHAGQIHVLPVLLDALGHCLTGFQLQLCCFGKAVGFFSFLISLAFASSFSTA